MILGINQETKENYNSKDIIESSFFIESGHIYIYRRVVFLIFQEIFPQI